MKCYIGIDLGSTSCKAVLINENGYILNHVYQKNIGLVKSIQDILKKLNVSEVNGIGITGSGREFGKILLNADLVKNEITAHATAAMNLYPKIKTIFEIGGEDAKLIQIESGIVTNFAMNTSCSSGTGTMIENIGEKLGIGVAQVGDLACKSKNNVSIAGKCSVFANSTAVNKRNAGIPIEDIMMGLCRAVVTNYLAVLVRNNKIHSPYMFQGATAFNTGLIKAFEETVQEKIIIPEYPHLMGAIGIALLLKESNIDNMRKIDVNANYNTNIRQGDKCSNLCEITDIICNGEVKGSIGNRCEKCIN